MVFYHIELDSSGNTFKVKRGRRRWIGLKHCPTTAEFRRSSSIDLAHYVKGENYQFINTNGPGPGGDKVAVRAALTGRESGAIALLVMWGLDSKI